MHPYKTPSINPILIKFCRFGSYSFFKMDPETFMHDRQTFRENLLTWANKLSADSTHDSIRMEIVSELEEMVKEKEVLGTPPLLGMLLAEDFDLVDSCSGLMFRRRRSRLLRGV
jgi:hypothetical protein